MIGYRNEHQHAEKLAGVGFLRCGGHPRRRFIASSRVFSIGAGCVICSRPSPSPSAPAPPCVRLRCAPSGSCHRVWAPLLEAAKLHKVRIHDLRHTYASLMIDAGKALHFVQQQLGHHSPAFTLAVYGHLLPRAIAGTK